MRKVLEAVYEPLFLGPVATRPPDTEGEDQRRSFNWETFRAYIVRHPLPRLRVYQPLF